MAVGFRDPVAGRIAAFLNEIGLPLRARATPDGTFLPGIHVEEGGLTVDESRLAYPGDLLHEAGHLAVVTADQRRSLSGDTGDEGGEELAAIAWSYAAALHLELDPAVVFHADGYRGGSADLLENFREGRYMGVPYLQWIGLTDRDYPKMIRWLR
jgi:hypothetical protein